MQPHASCRTFKISRHGLPGGARSPAGKPTSTGFRRYFSLAILTLLATVTIAEPGPHTSTAAVPPEQRAWGFPVGEILVYSIYWGYVPVGSTRISTQWTVENGKKLLCIRYRTLSNKVIASIYPVDDAIESIIDPVTFLPLRFTKNLREGRHKYREVTHFDYTHGVARWKSLISGKKKDFPISPEIRDLVSFLYRMRSQKIDPGDVMQFRVMADEKVYDLQLHAKTEERVELPTFGKVKSLRIVPKAQFNGLFVHKGEVTAWISRDARQLCTKLEAKVPVAGIQVELSEVWGPGDDAWIQNTREEFGDPDDPD